MDGNGQRGVDRQIRPLAVGTMIVAAFYTLYNLKDSLLKAVNKAVGDFRGTAKEGSESRLDRDINFKKIIISSP
jgi:uncharacterized oligopeptide transporter (OPT) family protein